jgi:hypothetical protein
MNRTYKIGIIAALIYIVFELAIVFLGYNHNENVHVIAFGVNTLILLLAVAYSILSEYNRKLKDGKGVSLLHDIKSGLRTVSTYAVMVSLFIFSYYNWIDPEYSKIRAQQHLERTQHENFEEQAKLKMEAAPEMYEGKSIEDLRDTNEAAIEMVLTPSFKNIIPMTLFSLILLGMVYTFVITGLNRLVLAKLF